MVLHLSLSWSLVTAVQAVPLFKPSAKPLPAVPVVALGVRVDANIVAEPSIIPC